MALHVLGVLTAIHAVMTARTSQGAIAWALLLILFRTSRCPPTRLFGRGKFQGYVKARRAGDSQIDHIARRSKRRCTCSAFAKTSPNPKYVALEELAETPFTSHNDAKLLINGSAAFPAMFAGIEAAKDYIIVQFYIIRDDNLGRQLKELLERKAARGSSACTCSTTRSAATTCRGPIAASWPRPAS